MMSGFSKILTLAESEVFLSSNQCPIRLFEGKVLSRRLRNLSLYTLTKLKKGLFNRGFTTCGVESRPLADV